MARAKYLPPEILYYSDPLNAPRIGVVDTYDVDEDDVLLSKAELGPTEEDLYLEEISKNYADIGSPDVDDDDLMNGNVYADKW